MDTFKGVQKWVFRQACKGVQMTPFDTTWGCPVTIDTFGCLSEDPFSRHLWRVKWHRWGGKWHLLGVLWTLKRCPVAYFRWACKGVYVTPFKWLLEGVQSLLTPLGACLKTHYLDTFDGVKWHQWGGKWLLLGVLWTLNRCPVAYSRWACVGVYVTQFKWLLEGVQSLVTPIVAYTKACTQIKSNDTKVGVKWCLQGIPEHCGVQFVSFRWAHNGA